MKLAANDPAPDFTMQDVNGNPVSLSQFKGKKVLLSLFRFSGCPICNFYFHEIQKNAALFQAKGLEIIAVQESKRESMQEFLRDEKYYATMIPDPQGKLYTLYGSERSFWKFIKGFFHGLTSKIKAGSKLFKHRPKQDGPVDRVGADFLIDENGKIAEAFYGEYVGDRLPVERIVAFANRPA